ncbi:hypothetical protein [Gimesia aquarii]|nr:hypothetical protein [Gimesia aquarii]
MEQWCLGFIHGEEAAQLLYDKLQGSQPVNLHPWGDSEVALLGEESLSKTPGVNPEALQKLTAAGGWTIEDRNYFRADMGKAICDTDILIVNMLWQVYVSVTMVAFQQYGISWDSNRFTHSTGEKKKVDLAACYRLAEYGLFWKALRDRKVLIISGLAPIVVERLRDKEWLKAQGCTWDFEVIGGIQCPSTFESKIPHWQQMKRLMAEYEWDIALSSCGATSIAVGNFAVELGRKSIDIGGVDMVISGKPRECVKGITPIPHSRTDFSNRGLKVNYSNLWIE